ncbi:hypothetical protein [Rariglobus hedericola]|uniref:DUF4397 domain-containing protein n=1 Tax=Rariglobus hedericola TaxID=2597822 RepID=A0A556QJI3_9BACT|nr:hypothetical protein [Rariglobus hedericola]TSJ76788.1 hypothetical protein FPL22_11740 [Rariglobus hedericola]
MALRVRHLILLVSALFILCGASLTAQPPATDTALVFTVYAPIDSPLWEQLYFLPAGKPPVKLAFLPNSRSVPIKLTGGPKPLVFGVERIDPETRQKTYVPVAETAWPEAAAKALVIFSTAAGTGPQVQLVAVDDGLKAFPLRSVRFFNATGVPLLVKVASFEGEVAPGISPARPYSVVSDNPLQVGTFPLGIAINDPQAGGRLLYQGSGEAWPFARSLIVMVPPRPGSTDLELRILVDTPRIPRQPTTESTN